MTPEGKIKKEISKVLDRYPHYRFMPVQMGLGTTTLDYLCCVNGRFLAVEAKAPGKTPTAQQYQRIKQIRDNGGETFVIDGERGLEALELWLIRNTK